MFLTKNKMLYKMSWYLEPVKHCDILVYLKHNSDIRRNDGTIVW